MSAARRAVAATSPRTWRPVRASESAVRAVVSRTVSMAESSASAGASVAAALTGLLLFATAVRSGTPLDADATVVDLMVNLRADRDIRQNPS